MSKKIRKLSPAARASIAETAKSLKNSFMASRLPMILIALPWVVAGILWMIVMWGCNSPVDDDAKDDAPDKVIAYCISQDIHNTLSSWHS